MALTVTHAKNVAIADDPKAAAAGEVLPSDWNANHTVGGTIDSSVGGRKLLTADTNYYVSATGSDSNGGTNSTTDAWATIQHAISFISGNVDTGGHTVTINIGAGSFAGFGTDTISGGGNVLIYGAGSASTTITNGPNDGFLNGSECISCWVAGGAIFFVNGVTLAWNSASAGIVSATFDVFAPTFLNFYHTPNFAADVKIDLTNVADPAHEVFWVDAPGTFIIDNGLTFVGAGSTVNNVILVESSAIYLLGTAGATWTVTGALTCGFSFAQVDQGGKLNTITTTAITGAGVTGQRFLLVGSGSVQSTAGANTLGPNFFPGTSAGTADPSSFYDGYQGAVSKSGLPANTDLSPGMEAVFKDTSGGGVYLAYNDAGTIKKVALT